MKKGFTLIELLAVIIILAIVALVATPIVLNVIETAEQSAAESEGKMIVSGIEQGCAARKMAANLDDKIDECGNSLDKAAVEELVDLGSATLTENITIDSATGKVTDLGDLSSNGYEIDFDSKGKITASKPKSQ